MVNMRKLQEEQHKKEQELVQRRQQLVGWNKFTIQRVTTDDRGDPCMIFDLKHDDSGITLDRCRFFIDRKRNGYNVICRLAEICGIDTDMDHEDMAVAFEGKSAKFYIVQKQKEDKEYIDFIDVREA